MDPINPLSSNAIAFDNRAFEIGNVKQLIVEHIKKRQDE
jgi:hypothetical protein